MAFSAGGLLTGAVGEQFPAAADQELRSILGVPGRGLLTKRVSSAIPDSRRPRKQRMPGHPGNSWSAGFAFLGFLVLHSWHFRLGACLPAPSVSNSRLPPTKNCLPKRPGVLRSGLGTCFGRRVRHSQALGVFGSRRGPNSQTANAINRGRWASTCWNPCVFIWFLYATRCMKHIVFLQCISCTGWRAKNI